MTIFIAEKQASQSFESYQMSILPTSFMLEPAQSWLGSFGQAKDELQERATQAVEASMVQFCPVDALGMHGFARGLTRGAAETDDQYRAWLRRAWQLWAEGGTSESVERQIAHALSIDKTRVHVLEIWPYQPGNGLIPPTGYSTTPPDGYWYADGDVARWGRFWVFIDGPWPWSAGPQVWDDPALTWDTSQVSWDTKVPGQTLQAIRSAIRTWKSAHATPVWFQLLEVGEYLWDYPVGGPTWGGSATWDAYTSVPFSADL